MQPKFGGQQTLNYQDLEQVMVHLFVLDKQWVQRSLLQEEGNQVHFLLEQEKLEQMEHY